MENPAQRQCPKCSTNIEENFYFCPNCGKPLRGKPELTTISKQIVVYLVSFFLAPFGLGYAFKYLRQPGRKSRIIGIISIILTITAIILMIITLKTYLDIAYKDLNSFINLGF